MSNDVQNNLASEAMEKIRVLSNGHAKKQLEQVNLLSEDAREILSQKVSKTVTTSLIICCAVIAIMIGVSWFIRYPDVQQGNFVITSTPATQVLSVKREGRIARIWKQDKELVKTNDPLLELENTMGYDNILVLEDRAHRLEASLINHTTLPDPGALPAGVRNHDMQLLWADLHEKLNLYVLTKGKGTPKEEAESKQGLRKAISGTIDMIKQWKELNLVSSSQSTDSRVHFLKELKTGDFVKEGEKIGYLMSEKAEFVAQVKIDPKGLAKVQPGQRVLLSLDYYPENDFGTLEGKVRSVNLFTEQGGAAQGAPQAPATNQVEIKLSSHIGSSNKEMQLIPDMTGHARIILEDRNLFEHLFSNVAKK